MSAEAPTRERLPEGTLIGPQAGTPLAGGVDQRVWTINEFGLRIYAAKGYCVLIEQGATPGKVQVDPSGPEWRGFMRALEAAHAHCQRRGK